MCFQPLLFKNYVTPEGVVPHNVLYNQQLSIARYQVIILSMLLAITISVQCITKRVYGTTMGLVVEGENTTVGVWMGIMPDTVTGAPVSPLIMAGNWNVFICEFMEGLSARGLRVLQKCRGTRGVPA